MYETNEQLMGKGEGVIICWVKVHIEIKQNELVDAEVKQATEAGSLTPNFKALHHNYIPLLRRQLTSKWQK